jgi:hypothetical protein
MNNIIVEFQLFYQKILDVYNLGISAKEKWTKIATYMHDNNPLIVKIFSIIKKEDDRKQISLDYQITPEQLRKQIEEESDALIKSSFIILALHHIIYDMMSTEGNYDFVSDGQEQMHILKSINKKITYYISVSVKNEQNIYFHGFILLYALESLFNKRFYLCVDFEYTNKKIQLAQLNFEHDISDKSMILIVSPNELEQNMTDNFINLIICNKYIKKILHGSDSLDIPYMYKYMLEDDSDKIIKFTRSLIDTRFLCEYYKLTRDQVSDNRCSIYDEDPSRSAVYFFNVVSEEQQKNLTELLQSMPAPHDIQWNIHKMPQSQIIYAACDVIFLKYFYYRIIHMATEDEESDLGKKAIITLYKHVLNEITRFVYLERNNITSLMAKCKEEVDVINNYFIKRPNGILKMIDIFNKVSVDLNTTDPKVNINKLIKVNHFKVPVMTIIKRIIYGFVSQKCRIQKDKSTIWTDKLSNQFIFDFLEEMEYFYLLKMFKDLSKTLEVRIKEICST